MAGDTVSRGNLIVILSAAGLSMGLFGSFLSQQNANLDRRLEGLASDIKENRTNELRKDEHVEFKYRVDRDIDRIERELIRKQSEIDEINRNLRKIPIDSTK